MKYWKSDRIKFLRQSTLKRMIVLKVWIKASDYSISQILARENWQCVLILRSCNCWWSKDQPVSWEMIAKSKFEKWQWSRQRETPCILLYRLALERISFHITNSNYIIYYYTFLGSLISSYFKVSARHNWLKRKTCQIHALTLAPK